MKGVISTETAPAAIGPYSQAIKKNGIVYVSGQIPINPKSGNIEAQTISDQARQSFTNIGEILQKAGMSFADVLKTTCFLKDMTDFSDFNKVYAEFFTGNCPARSCVAVKQLPKDALCEIEVIACK